MIEEWKAIPGYEGLYEVSNKGNVRNVRRNTLLRLTKTNKGYIQVGLSKNGILTVLKVHRLVAQAFLPNPDNLPMINHKDEDKTNNRVENLEWCTAKYNNTYGTRQDKVRDTAIKNGSWSGLSKEEYNKSYYEKNKDKKREYYEKNKEKIREKNRIWMEKHPDYMKKWRDSRNNDD